MEEIPGVQQEFDNAKNELAEAANDLDNANGHMLSALEKAGQILSMLDASDEQVRLVARAMVEANDHARKHDQDILVTSINVVGPCTDATPGASDRLELLYRPLFRHITDGEEAFTRTLRWLNGWHNDRFEDGIGRDLWHLGQHLPLAQEDVVDAKNSVVRAATHIDEYRKNI